MSSGVSTTNSVGQSAPSQAAAGVSGEMLAQLLLLGGLLTEVEVVMGKFEQASEGQHSNLASVFVNEASEYTLYQMAKQKEKAKLEKERDGSILGVQISSGVGLGLSTLGAIVTRDPALFVIGVANFIMSYPFFDNGKENAMQELESKALVPLFEDMGVRKAEAKLYACLTVIIVVVILSFATGKAGDAGASEAATTAEETAAVASEETAEETNANEEEDTAAEKPQGGSRAKALAALSLAQVLGASGLAKAIADLIISEEHFSSTGKRDKAKMEVESIVLGVVAAVSMVIAGIAAWKMPAVEGGSWGSATLDRMCAPLMRLMAIAQVLALAAQAVSATVTGVIDLHLAGEIEALGKDKSRAQLFGDLSSQLAQRDSAMVKNIQTQATAMATANAALGQAYAGALEAVAKVL